jgi:hypothetical protein
MGVSEDRLEAYMLDLYNRCIHLGLSPETISSHIQVENNIPVGEAVNKFLLDVDQQYNNKLGFESKVESLREEVNKLNQMQARLRSELITLPLVGPKLVKLTQSGVSKHEIIKIAAIFEKYAVGTDRQSFLADLEKYGGLK